MPNRERFTLSQKAAIAVAVRKALNKLNESWDTPFKARELMIIRTVANAIADLPGNEEDGGVGRSDSLSDTRSSSGT